MKVGTFTRLAAILVILVLPASVQPALNTGKTFRIWKK